MPKQTKQILSIDVGIKNLSFCLFEINSINSINDILQGGYSYIKIKCWLTTRHNVKKMFVKKLQLNNSKK